MQTSNLLSNLNTVHSVIGIMIVTTIILIIMNYRQKHYLISKEEIKNENFINNSSPSAEKNKFVLYYAPWCGYSKSFLPIWEKFKDFANKSQVSNVEIIEIDCVKEEDKCKKINGFPTIILYKPDGKEIPFNDARTVEKLYSFIMQN
jgi:thiol-disulfide isomerase/thioredoxin